ncbi:MAG: hypothetical protein NTX92_02445, partial [Euryarchaeota archaeon]|nr:hypothetical protein [Euryarchaeota archaeon]
SKKLGKKYLLRGPRLMVPFICIFVFIMTVASIVPLVSPVSIKGNADMQSAMDAVSASPFSGQYTVQTTDVQGGSIHLVWGFGIGAYLLLFAGILLIMAGLMEMTAHEQFYEEKSPAQINVEKKE